MSKDLAAPNGGKQGVVLTDIVGCRFQKHAKVALHQKVHGIIRSSGHLWVGGSEGLDVFNMELTQVKVLLTQPVVGMVQANHSTIFVSTLEKQLLQVFTHNLNLNHMTKLNYSDDIQYYALAYYKNMIYALCLERSVHILKCTRGVCTYNLRTELKKSILPALATDCVRIIPTAGHFYVSNTHHVSIFFMNGTLLKTVGQPKGNSTVKHKAGFLQRAQLFAVDTRGNALVIDVQNVHVYSNSSNKWHFISLLQMGRPEAILVHQDGRTIWLANKNHLLAYTLI